MFFSVLVPVHNAEEYIIETVQSILCQTDQDFEIVLLDDGSSDCSKQECVKLAQAYPEKIRFFSQKNTGVLLARRELAKLAKGEYLVYVDSDDYLVKTALSKIKSEIKKSSADIVFYDLQKKSKYGDEMYSLPIEAGVFKGENKCEIMRLLFLTKYAYSMCQKAIKKECFDLNTNYEEYEKMRIAEDVFQSFPIMDNARIIAYLKEPLYIYNKDSSGATSIIELSDFHWNMVLFDRQDEYIKKWRIDPIDLQTIAENRIRSILSFLPVYAKQKHKNAFRQFLRFVKELKTNKYFGSAKELADQKKLQKIYKLDLLLLKLHCFILLFFLNKYI